MGEVSALGAEVEGPLSHGLSRDSSPIGGAKASNNTVIPNQFSFLVWESPSNSGLLIVMQTVLLYRFPEFIHEKRYS